MALLLTAPASAAAPTACVGRRPRLNGELGGRGTAPAALPTAPRHGRGPVWTAAGAGERGAASRRPDTGTVTCAARRAADRVRERRPSGASGRGHVRRWTERRGRLVTAPLTGLVTW